MDEYETIKNEEIFPNQNVNYIQPKKHSWLKWVVIIFVLIIIFLLTYFWFTKDNYSNGYNYQGKIFTFTDGEKIKVLVIEFEGRNQANHGEVCCKNDKKECYFTYARESCKSDE